MIIDRIDFELLRVLIAVAESKNFYEAARVLGISQPAVSMKVKRLEEHCPIPAFSIRGKKKVLTRYGQELYEVSKRQIESCGKGIESLNRRYLSADKLVLRVGCRNEIFEAVAAKLLFEGRVELHSMSSHEAVLALQSHDIDLAISYERLNLAEVWSKRVLTSAAHLVVHSKWLKGRRLDLKTASDPGFLGHTPSVIYQADGHLMRDWLKSLNFDFARLQIAAVAQDWRVIQALIDGGHGYGIVPSYVRSHSPDVLRVELPKSVIPHFVFYGTFYRDLKNIPAFSQLLKRLDAKSLRE